MERVFGSLKTWWHSLLMSPVGICYSCSDFYFLLLISPLPPPCCWVFSLILTCGKRETIMKKYLWMGHHAYLHIVTVSRHDVQ